MQLPLYSSCMEQFYTALLEWAIDLLSDPTTRAEVCGGILMLIATMIKGIRDKISMYCKKASKWILNRHAKMNKDFTENLLRITEDLAIVRNTLDAARVSVYQFHNGDKFSLSHPIFKITCSYQSIANGLIPDSQHVKNVLVSTVLNFVSPLMDTRKPTIPGVCEMGDACDQRRVLKYNIDEIPYDGFKHIMLQQGTGKMYATLLSTQDGKRPIGILCMQYVDQDDSDTDTIINANLDYIRQQACRLEYDLDEAQQ